jgi:hypothetical protein
MHLTQHVEKLRRDRHFSDHRHLRSLFQAADGNESVHQINRGRREFKRLRYSTTRVCERGTQGVKLRPACALRSGEEATTLIAGEVLALSGRGEKAEGTVG